MSSAANDSRTQSVIELHYEDRGGFVRVVPPDRSVMVLPVKLAIQACRAFDDQVLFRDQFDLLLQRLAEWISKHKSVLERAYLTTRDVGLLFLVVRKDKVYDPMFESDLTSLDFEIANDDDFSLIRLDVLALPNSSEESVRSFLAPQNNLEYQMNG